MVNNRLRGWMAVVSFGLLAAVLWTLRSWNLEIGDGEFCCKQTVAEKAFEVTLSRSFLSYLLYRYLFFVLHPMLDWWVEDLIALSSCAAGLLFFFALYRLASATSENKTDAALLLLFPSTTLLLQIFCGHVEFYSWTCAFLMLSAWWSWETMNRGSSLIWPSAAMALAGAFHSSGVFYFPTLLLLPFLIQATEGERIRLSRQDMGYALMTMVIFLVAALLHRKPHHWTYVILFIAGVVGYFYWGLESWREKASRWVRILFPWLLLFAVRASLGLRAEPLLEHLPPLGEPYDHGAYLYEAFSWDHLYDKVMFHLWLTPFGLLAGLAFLACCWRRIWSNRWLLFLASFCVWAMVWSVLFYPQLRTRDWDLFASIAIPLNLFVVYVTMQSAKTALFRCVMIVGIVVHLGISLPIVLQNSALLIGRGYVELEYKPQPVVTHAYIRGLKIGETPLTLRNVRSGNANVRVVPLERGYRSWSEDVVLEPGKRYLFEPILEEIQNRLTGPPADSMEEVDRP